MERAALTPLVLSVLLSVLVRELAETVTEHATKDPGEALETSHEVEVVVVVTASDVCATPLIKRL
jgi:hypothetical protein